VLLLTPMLWNGRPLIRNGRPALGLVCDDCTLARTLTLRVSGVVAGGGACGAACNDLNDDYTLTYSDRIQCANFDSGEETWWYVWESAEFSIAGCGGSGNLMNRKWVFAIPEAGTDPCHPVLKLTAFAAGACELDFDHRTAATWRGQQPLTDCNLPIELSGMWDWHGGWSDCDYQNADVKFEIF